jgi:hypothetical protein
MSPASPPPIINRCSAPSRSYVLAALRALHLDHACAPAFDGSHGEPGITKISLIQVSTVPGESRLAHCAVDEPFAYGVTRRETL